MSERTRWAHSVMSHALANVQHAIGPGFPRATMIVRDPDDPECFIVASNEPEDVTDRLVAGLYPRSTLDSEVQDHE